MEGKTLETERQELDARLQAMRADGFESHQDLLDYGDLLGRLLQIEARLEKPARGSESRQ